jgi:anion-transporting  ArsA/GET3 family ATPase
LTGKGGVGKTTICAALGLHAARMGRRPLVVELGHRASMSSVFGIASVAHAPTDVGHGVHAVSVDADDAILDFATAQLRVRRVARAVVSSRALSGFLRAAPAVAEVAAYHYLSALLDETLDGTPRWDPILVDLDATGHALMFLELPRVLDGLVGHGPLRGLIDSLSARLADPDVTALHLVTLPSELPALETESLSRTLSAEHRVALGRVFINRVPTVPLAPELAPARRALEALGDASIDRDLALLARAEAERARALEVVSRLDALPHETVTLPTLDAPDDIEALAALGALAAGAPR